LYGHAIIGCRKIVRIFEVFSKEINLSIPHHTTVRQWFIRFGCHSLQTPLNKAEDWISIADLTISMGKLKCLAILGVQQRDLEKKENLILTHKDVQLLGLYPTEKSTGDFIERAFEDSAERVGGNFLATIVDRGSDIKKGARQFQEKHPSVKLMHDISHKLSNVVEHELKNDAKWSEYIHQLNLTRKKCFQTEFAAIMPKKQREKARFMDISHLVYFPERILKSKEKGFFRDIPEERYQDYLGWIDGFSSYIEQWGFMVGIVNFIKKTVNSNGLSSDVYIYMKTFLEESLIKDERLKAFISNILKTVKEEADKLDEEQTLICSTEVIESIFGKYKAINEGLHGISASILGIATFVGKEKDENQIKEAMEGISVKKAIEWVKEKFGKTIASLRKKFFPNHKRTKFDNKNGMALSH
jgi:hypothetical protein